VGVCQEEELDKIYGKVGVDEGYLVIRKKVLDKIAEVYPWLREECDSQ